MVAARYVSSLVTLACIAMATFACSPAEEQEERVEPEQVFPDPPTEGDPTGEARLRTVYVPAYSHLHASPQITPHMLSILLSVRNMDSLATVTLTHVDYFDTSGHRVRRYLAAPIELRPLQTAEYVVERNDEAGGSGANFLVYWEGPSDAHPLLTEAVMWGHVGAGYISFTSRGVELARRPDPKAFLVAPGAADGVQPAVP